MKNSQSQNELVDMIGISTIQKGFINDIFIKESKLYSVMVVEVTASNDEVVTMCFCYVASKKGIQEVFLEFFDVGRVSGAVRKCLTW